MEFGLFPEYPYYHSHSDSPASQGTVSLNQLGEKAGTLYTEKIAP